MGPGERRRHRVLDDNAHRLADSASERWKLSARAVPRTLEVARTISDVAGREQIQATHAAESIQYRSLDRRIERA